VLVHSASPIPPDPAGPLFITVITEPQLRSLVLVLLASTLGALLSRLQGRVLLPTVVLEIALGVLFGPQVLGIASVNPYIQTLSDFGLALLFFVAGVEIVEARVAPRLVRQGTIGWVISLALGLAAGLGLQLAGLDARWWLVGIALCTTSLGTLVPILTDAGVFSTPLGSAVLGSGIAGEFWPIVFISIFLTGAYGAWKETLLLIGFGILVLVTAAIVVSARPLALIRVLRETVQTTGQAAVRGSIFVLSALVLLATEAGFDFVLGAFAAGLVVGLVLDSPEGREVRLRLEGIGFGFLIPIYFVSTGLTFDLDSLLTPSGLGLGLLFLVLLLIVRGASAFLWAPALDRRDVLPLALFSATGLPLIVAIVGIGQNHGGISAAVGASLVGAGMLSVLVYPVLALQLFGQRQVSREPHRA